MNILSYIQKLLDDQNQPCTLMEATEDFPYERILVACGNDVNKTDILEITVHSQFSEKTFSQENIQENCHLVQFQLILPLEIIPENFNQVSSCLHFFNRLLHCPGFELDELSDRVIYRYVWFIKRKGMDIFLLKQILGNIELCFHMFSPYIKDIAEGRYTLEDILEQVLTLSKQQST